ncbi:hypothetical protein [Hydrogenophaga intermedia]|uniref:Uncharacterized protein n=1 Tax=Hydrogenophaga intermedia TaxID=65786 RepID=A0A1L1PFG1_HYDIT|nr:hypothetical protein [Hydrogenophaga intermedia]CDN87494.1 hypothetical protein BN948_01916 [Hydrogenophaga intermedia]
MDQATLMKYGIAAAIAFAAWKYGGTYGKAGAVAVAAVAVARRTPYIREVL